tara:strand:- start:27123 stop:27770 length:648 start_codon:yes stop_codon:yes gene_type:complete
VLIVSLYRCNLIGCDVSGDFAVKFGDVAIILDDRIGVRFVAFAGVLGDTLVGYPLDHDDLAAKGTEGGFLVGVAEVIHHYTEARTELELHSLLPSVHPEVRVQEVAAPFTTKGLHGVPGGTASEVTVGLFLEVTFDPARDFIPPQPAHLVVGLEHGFQDVGKLDPNPARINEDLRSGGFTGPGKAREGDQSGFRLWLAALESEEDAVNLARPYLG